MAAVEGGAPAYDQVHSANGAMRGNAFMSIDQGARRQ